MVSRRVLAVAVLGAALVFLFQKPIVQMFSGPPERAIDPLQLTQRDLDALYLRMTNHSTKLEGNFRGMVREEQAKLRYDIVREITTELKSYLEALKEAAPAAKKEDASPPPPPAAPAPAPEKQPANTELAKPKAIHVEISSLITEQCIDTNPLDTGTVVRTWNCHHGEGGDYQKYSVTKSGQIRHTLSGYCLSTVQSTSDSTPAPVKLEPCNDKTAAHHWSLSRYGGKSVQLRNKATGRCLLAPARDDVSDPVLAVSCEPRCAQFWSVGNTDAPITDMPATSCKPDPIAQIISMGGNECLDANPLKDGTLVRTFSCHGGKGGPYQAFSITADGKIKIKPSWCLDGADPAGVRLRACANVATQTWQLSQITTTSQFLWLRNAGTGLCLRSSIMLPGGNRAPATLVNCSRSCSQLWNSGIQAAPTMLAAPRSGPAKSSKGPSPVRTKDRIFCWVLTHPREHAKRATAINNTWGRECTYLVFVTSQNDPTLPTVVADLPGPDTRDALWAKTRWAFMYAYKHYLDKAEWFCKFDDDTLVIMPNLREFLAKYKHTDPHYFGRRLWLGGSDDQRMSYYSGGGGYVISKNVLERLGKAVTADPTTYVGPWNAAEDFAFGETMHKIGVDTEDTRDETGAHRFSVLGIGQEKSVVKERNDIPWYWQFTKDSREGPTCCSKRWITSHYEPAEAFYAVDEMRKTGCENDMTVWPFLEIPE